jgi:cathepsin K
MNFKKNIKVIKNTFLIILIIIVMVSSCQDPYIEFNSVNQDQQIITDTIIPNPDITVPDTITPEES